MCQLFATLTWSLHCCKYRLQYLSVLPAGTLKPQIFTLVEPYDTKVLNCSLDLGSPSSACSSNAYKDYIWLFCMLVVPN